MATADYRAATDVVRHRWLCVALLITFTVWGALDVVPRGGINWKRIHEHRTDFTVYTEAGAAFFDGRDPYQVTNPRGWRYLYPPLFAIVVAPLHALPSQGQVCVWFVLSVAMVFGCYVEMRRSVALLNPHTLFYQDNARRLSWMGIAVLLAALLPALNCLQRGQVEVLKLYLLLLGLRLALAGTRARQWCLAGIVLALASILKLTPLLPVACLILYDAVHGLNRQYRRVAWQRACSLSAGVGAGLLAFAFFLPASILGWNANLHHLETWTAGVVTKVIDVRTSDFGEDVRTVRNQSLDNAAYRFGNWINAQFAGGPDDSEIDRPHATSLKLPMDMPRAGEMIVFGRIASLALLFVFLVRAARSEQPVGRAATFGLACVATLVVCPVARGCYFVLFLPAAFFNSMWLLQLGRRRMAYVVAVAPAVVVWLYYLLLPNSGRIGLLGLGTTAWFLATCVLLDNALRSARTVPQVDCATLPSVSQESATRTPRIAAPVLACATAESPLA